MPVVPLCDVHPSFGKVTTLNRENTKDKIQGIKAKYMNLAQLGSAFCYPGYDGLSSINKGRN